MYYSGFASVMTEEEGWEVHTSAWKSACYFRAARTRPRLLSETAHFPKLKCPMLEGTRRLDSHDSLLSQRAMANLDFDICKNIFKWNVPIVYTINKNSIKITNTVAFSLNTAYSRLDVITDTIPGQ